MSVKGSIFAVFAFCVVAVFGSSSPLPQPTFLKGLNKTATSAFKNIEENTSLSMNGINQQLSQWASQQSPDVQSAFNAWQQSVNQSIADMVSQADSKAGSLNSDAQSLYQQTKTIALNFNVPISQTCTQLKALYKQAHDSTIFTLYRAFPNVVKLGLNMCSGKFSLRRKRQMYGMAGMYGVN